MRRRGTRGERKMELVPSASKGGGGDGVLMFLSLVVLAPGQRTNIFL